VWEPNDEEHTQVPGAPRMKDLDSFTDGTGKGSFDSIPAASTNEFGEPIHAPNALSLELLPVADPNMSVERWRKEVYIDSHAETLISDTKHTADSIDALSEMTLMSPQQPHQERFVDRPRMTLGVATSAVTHPVRVCRHIKRARSWSPDPTRRTRPRSNSLILGRSASAINAAADLVGPPLVLSVPWLLPHVPVEPPD